MSNNKNKSQINEVNETKGQNNPTNVNGQNEPKTSLNDQLNDIKKVVLNGETIELKRDFINPFDKSERPTKQGVLFVIGELVKNSPDGLTKGQILEVLANKFVDREVKSLASTVSVQVPTRLSKDKGFIFETKTNNDGQKVYIYKGQKDDQPETDKETV